MKSYSSLLLVTLLVTVISVTSCGKKKNDDGSETPPYVSALALGSDAMGYGLNVLASTNRASPSATLTSVDTALLDSSQDSALPDCSVNGEPWDKITGARMQISNPKYSQTVFYCQTNSKKSPDTLAGTISQYKRVLCDVERVLGSVEYTAAGKEYANVAMSTTEACGWSASQVMSGMTATITAYAPTSGDWEKRLKIAIPASGIDYDLYFTIKSNIVAFKAVEGWNQARRIQSGDSNQNISSVATGTRGSVITIDVANGILRAESVDTYWSRRFRFYMKGTLNSTTGVFTTITDGQGIVANFDSQTGLYAEIATAKGNETDGFLHGTYQFATTNVASVRTSTTLSTNATACSKTSGCAGQTAISFGTEAADFDFLMIGAAWDSQTNSRTAIQDWLTPAGFPTFTGATKDKTI